MHWRLAAERRAGKLAGAVRDDLVDVHVELGPAAGHPHMQRKHVAVFALQDLIGDLDYEIMRLVVQPPAGVVGVGRCLLEDGVRGDHLARDQILADAEMLERPLGLCAPKLVSGHGDFTQTIRFHSKVGHPALHLPASRRILK